MRNETQEDFPHEGGTAARHKFGTFAGVFTPSILTIFGVIMFLRAGYVIGEVGIMRAILILLMAEVICFVTAISMSAIATNIEVKGGGAYYLISRVMGPQFGGAIGVVLYLGQTLSIPFYVLGFTEALMQTLPALRPISEPLNLGIVVVLFTVNYLGAHWAIKSQYPVMVVLGLGILSLLAGGVLHFSPHIFVANQGAGYTTPGISFWILFAVFFPAVTGMLAGINMSGDLKNPGRSLVRGTFAAVTVGLVVYLAEILLCGGSQTRTDLIERPFQALLTNAIPGTAFLIVAAVFAATLSSAISSFMTAPRVLQALARDRILPGLAAFSKGSSVRDEPRQALLLTLLISLGVVHMASGKDSLQAFDAVATLVTMFFLCTYGLINLAAFVASFGDNPSFRPRFRAYHWQLSLAGAASCLGAMMMIDLGSAVVAVIFISMIYIVIGRRVFKAGFGDSRHGFVYALVSKCLRAMESMVVGPQNWRPTVLVLLGQPQSRLALLRCGVWLGARTGIVTAATIISGDFRQMAERQAAMLASLKSFFTQNHLDVLPEVVIARDLDEGIRLMVQIRSTGGIQTNTVLMGWPSDPDRIMPFAHHLDDIKALGKNAVVVVDHALPVNACIDGPIDVWWRGQENGQLMVILAHLVTRNWVWRRAKLRIFRHIRNAEAQDSAYKDLNTAITRARIDVDISVVVSEEPFGAVLRRRSREAGLLFLGFTPPEEKDAREFHRHTEELLLDMPTTMLVSSIGQTDLLL